MSNRQRIVLIAGVIIALILAFLARDYVRDNVAPVILYILWSIYYIYLGISQFTLWGLFMGVMLVIAIRSLWSNNNLPEPAPAISVKPPAGRVKEHALLLTRMTESQYFRQRIVRHLATLTLDVLGHRDKLTPQEARELIDTGRFQLSPTIREYLENGWDRTGKQSDFLATKTPWHERLFGRFRPQSPRVEFNDPHLIEMIEFLEDQLEVQRDN